MIGSPPGSFVWLFGCGWIKLLPIREDHPPTGREVAMRLGAILLAIVLGACAPLTPHAANGPYDNLGSR